MKGKSTSSKSLLVTGDMHVGYKHALCSPNPIISEINTTFSPEEPCRVFYEHWCSIPDRLQNGIPDYFVINGEPIDGPNRKSQGAGNWSNNVNDQMNEAYKLIRLQKFHRIMATRGSGYHVSDGPMNWEETLYRRFNNFEPYSKYDTQEQLTLKEYREKHGKEYEGQLADMYIIMGLNSSTIDIAHHVGTSINVTFRTSAIAREMMNMKFEEGKLIEVGDTFDLSIRSHIHYYVYVEYSGSIGCVVPAWKLADDFQLKRGIAGTSPTVGAVEFIFETNGDILHNKIILPSSKYPKPRKHDGNRKMPEMEISKKR